MISFLTTNFKYFLYYLLLQYSHTYEYSFSNIKIVTEKLQIYFHKKDWQRPIFFTIRFELVLVLYPNDHLIFLKYLLHFFVWNVIINTTNTFISTFNLHFFHLQVRSSHIFRNSKHIIKR